ncbi:hypothetical protein BSKO_09732 [Bryopsis sp. KO-2023]|nr:hypothetical protein BSKO_09732 [Bryopsis sp. KO-2023]
MAHGSVWRGDRLRCQPVSEPRRQDAVFDNFLMFTYKIVTCPRKYSHDWIECPYSHSGESARRREPHTYKPIPCPESKGGQPCPRGDSCKYAHNDFEYWLHPTRYKTEYCKKGSFCTRKVCFFAHKPEHLRVAPPALPPNQSYPSWSPDSVGSHRATPTKVQASTKGGIWHMPQKSGNVYPRTGEQSSPLEVRGGVPGNLKMGKGMDMFRLEISSGQLVAVREPANPNNGESRMGIASAGVHADPPSPEMLHGARERAYSSSMLMGLPAGVRGLPGACRLPTTAQPHMVSRGVHERTLSQHWNKMASGGALPIPRSEGRPHSAPLWNEE